MIMLIFIYAGKLDYLDVGAYKILNMVVESFSNLLIC